MKNTVKEMSKALCKMIVDMVDFVKSNYQVFIIAILGLSSACLIIGSVGAHEVGNIETFQFILQIAIGFLLAAVVVFYVKYQIAKEEKAELLEELEEMRKKEKEVNRFELFK